MLKGFIDSIEGLPEAVAVEYKLDEKSGKFKLEVEKDGGWEFTDTTNLKSALGKEREKANIAEKALEAFRDLDPAAARDALSKVEEMTGWTSSDKVKEQIAANQKQLIVKHEEEKAALKKREEIANSALEKHMITNTALRAISKAKGNDTLLLPHVKAQVKLKNVNGEFFPEVIDETGTPRIGDSQGNAMTIDQLVEEMRGKEEFAGAFEGTGSRGSGVVPQTTGAPGVLPAEGGKIVISRKDKDAMGRNIENIANGKVSFID